MKIAVYNRFWNTAGGGERFAGTVAELLAEEHDVTLVSHEPIDCGLLRDRLGLRLDEFDHAVLEHAAPTEFRHATEKYDVLFNCSHETVMPCGSRHGLLAVYFPARPNTDLNVIQRAAIRTVGPAVRPKGASVEAGAGFYPPERSGRRRWMWSTGKATMLVFIEDGPTTPFRLVFSTEHNPHHLRPRITVAVDGRVVFDDEVPRGRVVDVQEEVAARPDGGPVEVVLTAEPFVHAELHGGNDWRELGVMVTDLTAGRQSSAARRITTAVPTLRRKLTSLDHLDTYDRLVANSEYTAGWVQRLWRRPATVLYPPVEMHAAGVKRPIIVSTGRFFARDGGHSKKQLEMVRAFRALHRGGLAEGWELHLVGGASDDHLDYVEQVRAEARGEPVHVHLNAPQQVVRDLYAAAAVYWHATGLHERARRHPERLEHFGISPVEAMSAGAVPVVFDGGGLREIVTHGVNGFRFRTEAELVGHTAALIERPALRAELAEAAAARAQDFAVEQFGRRLARLVDEVTRL